MLFALFLFSVILFGMSFVSAEKNVTGENQDTSFGDDLGNVVPVPADIPDWDMPQITPTISIIANDTYHVCSSSDVVEIGFKTNIANNDFWVEIPGLLERTNLTSDGNFKATLYLSNITKSGNYTILCGFPEGKYPDYVYAVVAGSDMMPGVADKKTIQINCLPEIIIVPPVDPIIDEPTWVTVLSVEIIANDTYKVYSSKDIVTIKFKTNVANIEFWVEIPGLLKKTTFTSVDEFKVILPLSKFKKSAKYTISCGFYENQYHCPLCAGPGDEKTIQINYIESQKTDSTKSKKLSTKFVVKNSVFWPKNKS